MSKVFKHSDSFTPQEILPGKQPSELVWEQLAKPEESIAPPQPTIEKQQAQPITPNNFKEIDSETTVEGQAAPESVGQPLPSSESPVENQPVPDHQEPIPEPVPETINIEALAQEHYERGYQDCLNNTNDDFHSSTKALLTACTEINIVRETILNNSMQEMQNLVFKIVEKILRVSVTEQNETIIQTVEEAIRRAVKSDEFVIQVNPNDYDIIKEKSTDFINSLSGLENIIVKPDPKIEQGGCFIESSNCTVDATIDVQLEMIKNKIQETN